MTSLTESSPDCLLAWQVGSLGNCKRIGLSKHAIHTYSIPSACSHVRNSLEAFPLPVAAGIAYGFALLYEAKAKQLRTDSLYARSSLHQLSLGCNTHQKSIDLSTSASKPNNVVTDDPNFSIYLSLLPNDAALMSETLLGATTQEPEALPVATDFMSTLLSKDIFHDEREGSPEFTFEADGSMSEPSPTVVRAIESSPPFDATVNLDALPHGAGKSALQNKRKRSCLVDHEKSLSSDSSSYFDQMYLIKRAKINRQHEHIDLIHATCILCTAPARLALNVLYRHNDFDKGENVEQYNISDVNVFDNHSLQSVEIARGHSRHLSRTPSIKSRKSTSVYLPLISRTIDSGVDSAFASLKSVRSISDVAIYTGSAESSFEERLAGLYLSIQNLENTCKLTFKAFICRESRKLSPAEEFYQLLCLSTSGSVLLGEQDPVSRDFDIQTVKPTSVLH